MGPAMCVIWATMDVLMCTASIWHMCTMSMDRYFTLKYPMKYGRNKTTSMVVTKILFVWIVSISISSPVCVLGFIDYNNVYNNNLCVPTIRSFIIYGSIFAFYVPLFIMVLTYGMTIQILCVNQNMMKKIAKDYSGKNRHRKENNGPLGATYLSPNIYNNRYAAERPSFDTSFGLQDSADDIDTQDESGRDMLVIAEKHISGCHTSLLDSSPPRDLSLPPTIPPSKPSSLPPSCASSQTLLVTTRPEDQQNSILNSDHTSVESVKTNIENPLCGKFIMKSNTSLNSNFSAGFNFCHSDCNNDPDMFEKLSQIEQEMNDCLQEVVNDPDSESDSDSNRKLLDDVSKTSPRHTGNGGISHSYSLQTTSLNHFENCSEAPCNIASQNCQPDDTNTALIPRINDNLSNSSSCSNLVTIKLQPSGCYIYRMGCDKDDVKDDQIKATPNGVARELSDTSIYLNEQLVSDDNLDDSMSMSYSTSTVGQSSRVLSNSNMFINKKHQINRKSSVFKTFLKQHTHKGDKKKGAPYLISKRTASNEKKASKVLGIIFGVFVILWTPFFIMNVVAAVCESCIMSLTPSVMASIVWLGYLSSLANPIIYTMFNTAFRRAFVKILTCGYPAAKTAHGTDTYGLNNTSHWDQRRNTMTISLKEMQ